MSFHPRLSAETLQALRIAAEELRTHDGNHGLGITYAEVFQPWIVEQITPEDREVHLHLHAHNRRHGHKKD